MRTKNTAYFAKIEGFINQYYETYGAIPSIRDIADGIGSAKSTVARYINDMKENSLIECGADGTLFTKEILNERFDCVRVPVLGRVSCGIPKFAEENIEGFVKLPSSLFGVGEFFILYADGDSMIDAGINNGDAVLVRKQSFAQPGQIVVALDGDEATLKRFYPEPENNRIRLHPENKTLKDIYSYNCIVQGIAVKVIKELE